jgi:hypothetical protein
MRVITNTDIIESRSKWAKRISPAAMLVLIGGFLLNLYSFDRPEYTQYTFILLMIGLLLAMVSSHLVNRWVREPRADQVLSNTLKKFGKEFVLFNYTTTPPHILITPSRLYAIVVKRQTGQVTVDGERFKRKFTLTRLLRIFAEESLGVPVAEAGNNIGKLQKLLAKNMDEQEIPEIKSFIVFVNKDVELIVNDPAMPTMLPNELKTYLRENDKHNQISATLRNKLVGIIGGEYAAAESKA